MKKLVLALLLGLMTLTSNAQVMKLGDLSNDNIVNVTDVTLLVDIILNGYAPFSVPTTQVTMDIGSTANVAISGGYGTYEVESANPDIVTASLNNLTVTLTAVGGGETTVTVRDVLTFRIFDIPVVVNNESLSVSTKELSLVAGKQGVVYIYNGRNHYSVQSSDSNVATATVSGTTVTVSAVGAGTARIIVTDMMRGRTAVINVTVTPRPVSYLTCPDDHHPHLIDLGLPSGTLWSCSNMGAEKPELCGDYYAWGEVQEKIVYDDVMYQYCTGEDNDGDGWYDDYHSDIDWYGVWQSIGSNIAGTQYDVVHVKWGGFWVMPSKDQINELLDYCTNEWTTVNRISGKKFTSKNNGGSIFLPAAGHRWGANLNDAGNKGYYWSSTYDSWTPSCAYLLDISSAAAYMYGNGRNAGQNIRPVLSY